MSLAELIVIFCGVLIKGLDLYFYVIVAYCLFSFIPQAFSHPIGYKIYMIVYKLAKPAFDLVYMIIPARFLTIGMISLTPIVIFVGIHLLQLGLIQLLKFILSIF